MQPMNRLAPQAGPEAYKTYAILAPTSTHFRPATCAEVDCPNYLRGWRVRVEGLPAELLHTAKTSGRRWREQRIAEGETWLLYEAGQPCFEAGTHRLRLDKPELFLVREGDFRGNPRGTKARMHQRPADWVDDFGEHQQHLADEHQKG